MTTYTAEQIKTMRRKLPGGAPCWTDDMVIAYVTTYYDLVLDDQDKSTRRAESGYAD